MSGKRERKNPTKKKAFFIAGWGERKSVPKLKQGEAGETRHDSARGTTCKANWGK